jgi:hypothetical protein
MTEFVELVLDWNRGAGWEAPTEWTLPGEAFAVEVPVTVGTQPAPGAYPSWDGLRPIASHVVTSEDPDAQAAAVKGLVSHRETPIMLLPAPIPTATALDELLSVSDALENAGLKPRIVFIPEFYWRALGAPDLRGPLSARGLLLMTQPEVYGISTYAGDADPGWCGIGGFRADEVTFLRPPGAPFAAYRGSATFLGSLLDAPVPAAPAPAPAVTTGTVTPQPVSTPVPGLPGLTIPGLPRESPVSPSPVFPTLEGVSKL